MGVWVCQPRKCFSVLLCCNGERDVVVQFASLQFAFMHAVADGVGQLLPCAGQQGSFL
jgi:hypothetical protein